MKNNANLLNKAQDILNRMKTAHDKGKGIRLSYSDLQALYITSIGELWEQKDPRENKDANSL